MISFQRRRDADLRLAPVVVAHADRAQHAARRGALEAVGDDAAVRLAVPARRLAGHGRNLTGYRRRRDLGRRRAVADGPHGTRASFRLPRPAYLVVLLLLLCVLPLALAGDVGDSGAEVDLRAARGAAV